jgi:hypothetical protein
MEIVDNNSNYCLLFNILMATTVSIVKKIRKMIKKFFFSIDILVADALRMGCKKKKAIPILRIVKKRKVNPTLLIFFLLTPNKITEIKIEAKKKKQYSNSNE